MGLFTHHHSTEPAPPPTLDSHFRLLDPFAPASARFLDSTPTAGDLGPSATHQNKPRTSYCPAPDSQDERNRFYPARSTRPEESGGGAGGGGRGRPASYAGQGSGGGGPPMGSYNPFPTPGAGSLVQQPPSGHRRGPSHGHPPPSNPPLPSPSSQFPPSLPFHQMHSIMGPGHQAGYPSSPWNALSGHIQAISSNPPATSIVSPPADTTAFAQQIPGGIQLQLRPASRRSTNPAASFLPQPPSQHDATEHPPPPRPRSCLRSSQVGVDGAPTDIVLSTAAPDPESVGAPVQHRSRASAPAAGSLRTPRQLLYRLQILLGLAPDYLESLMDLEEIFSPRRKISLQIEAMDPRKQQKKVKDRASGVPLHAVPIQAMCHTVIGPSTHRLPSIVFTIVEEIYRRGLATPGLFRLVGDTSRSVNLYNSMVTGPSYGENLSISNEPIHTLSGILKLYLRDLPQPLVHPSIWNALDTLCIEPDPKKLQIPIETRVASAQILLRLMPPRSFSLLFYLLTFLHEIPKHGNRLTLTSVSIIFGPMIAAPRGFGIPGVGPSDQPSLLAPAAPPRADGSIITPRPSQDHSNVVAQSQTILLWLITNWEALSEGLLEPDLDLGEVKDGQARRISQAQQQRQSLPSSQPPNLGNAVQARAASLGQPSLIRPPKLSTRPISTVVAPVAVPPPPLGIAAFSPPRALAPSPLPPLPPVTAWQTLPATQVPVVFEAQASLLGRRRSSDEESVATLNDGDISPSSGKGQNWTDQAATAAQIKSKLLAHAQLERLDSNASSEQADPDADAVLSCLSTLLQSKDRDAHQAKKERAKHASAVAAFERRIASLEDDLAAARAAAAETSTALRKRSAQGDDDGRTDKEEGSELEQRCKEFKIQNGRYKVALSAERTKVSDLTAQLALVSAASLHAQASASQGKAEADQLRTALELERERATRRERERDEAREELRRVYAKRESEAVQQLGA